MYPAPFEYLPASSWDEAVALLGAHGGDEPRVIAGGQSLGPMMNLRLAQPSHLIDLNPIGVEPVRVVDDILVVPALTRHHELATSSAVRASHPLLAAAASMIGNIRVRHRGTIGGSLANADPAAELPCATTAAGAVLVVHGPEGAREIRAEDAFLSYFTSALGPDELVREIRVPVLGPGEGWAFQEFVRRAGDFALVEVAVLIRATGVEVVVGGVDERPRRLPDLAAAVHADPSPATVARAALEAAAALEPPSSDAASTEYRRHLAGVLLRRAIGEAVQRARGEAA